MKSKAVTLPPHEIELKFQLLPGSEAILRAGDIFDHAAQDRHQVTTYHDTSDNLLFTSGLTLRIRQENDRYLQTVALRDNGIGLANSRQEWEWAVANDTPEVNHLAAVSELASIAGRVTGRLLPVIVTDIWRTSGLHVAKGCCTAEASLDVGTVSSGAMLLPICESELELKDGDVAELYRLALQLVVSDKCEPVSVSPTQPHTSGSEKTAPLSESGGAGQLVGFAVLEVALRRKVVVDRGMD